MNIERNITINAPVEKVFDTVADTTTLPEYIPSMMEVRNVRGVGLDRTYDWTFKLVGLKFVGSTRIMEFERNRRIVTRSEAGISSTWAWDFQEKGEGKTLLNLKIEYKVPGKVLAKLSEPLLRRQNIREAELALENLKELVESRTIVAA